MPKKKPKLKLAKVAFRSYRGNQAKVHGVVRNGLYTMQNTHVQTKIKEYSRKRQKKIQKYNDEHDIQFPLFRPQKKHVLPPVSVSPVGNALAVGEVLTLRRLLYNGKMRTVRLEPNLPRLTFQDVKVVPPWVEKEKKKIKAYILRDGACVAGNWCSTVVGKEALVPLVFRTVQK
ncbi:hypothetical protein ADEAN_000200000 [Angomonas deanei]|uniref:Uncharacterized protein n=1 Tax=Angomonas deanei TaxID=59799 RepID=A0A7G2C4A9_9TRYP|nr:hypothetical protein ADEAN_000200000 [Angomonas deanei]